MKLVPSPAGSEWMWSRLLAHPGAAFKRPTNGLTPTRTEAAQELVSCCQKFRPYYGLD